MAGIVLGKYLPWTGAGWGILAAACLALAALLSRVPAPGPFDRGRAVREKILWLGRREPRILLPPVVLLAALFIGAARIAFHTPEAANGHVAGLNEQGRYRIVGVIAAPPELREQSSLLRVEAETAAALDDSGRPGEAYAVRGLVMVVLPPNTSWKYGDRLALDGSPVTPPGAGEEGEFSYREYLARQGIYSYLKFPRVRRLDKDAGNPLLAVIYGVREWSYNQIYRLFPAPEAPLLAGILLGMDDDMPPDLAKAYRDTGTAHVIAISGANIAVLVGIFFSLFGRIFSRWWATILSILAIGIYTVLVGAMPSVVRAAIMGCLSLLAHQIGRRSAGLNTLFISGAAMCLHHPLMPWDASFQLSFSATAGLILYGERFQNGFQRLLERRLTSAAAQRIAGPVGEYVLLTLAAQLMTLPVILYHFQRLSLSSLLINPLILPAQPPVMVLSGLAVLAAAVSDPLARLLAALAWPFPAYTNRMVELFGRIPGGVLVLGEMNIGTAALMYAAVLLPLVRRRLPAAAQHALRPGMLLIGTGLLAAVLAKGALSAPDGRLRLLVLDIEGSQVVLLRAPAGETLLINGGPSARQLDNALGRWLWSLDHRLDVLLLNNPRAAALNALPGVIERYPPGRALWGCAAPELRAAEELAGLLSDNRIPAQALSAGETLVLGKARVEVTAKTNEGAALLLTWENFRVLLPGGIPPGSLPKTAVTGLSLVVLEERDIKQVGPAEWTVLVPQAVIATPGGAALPPVERNWINTRPGGWLSVTTDGQRMWLEQK